MKRRMRDADEYDAFTRWRKYYFWKRGQLAKIKRRANKRERREAFIDVELPTQCCTCQCGHWHRPDPLLIYGARCVLCNWCMCNKHRAQQYGPGAGGVDKVLPKE